MDGTTAWMLPGTKVLYKSKNSDLVSTGVVLQPKKEYAVVLLDDGRFTFASDGEITVL